MSIFKLDRHLKPHNVTSSMANVSVWLEFQYIAFWKNRLNYNMAAMKKIFDLSG